MADVLSFNESPASGRALPIEWSDTRTYTDEIKKWLITVAVFLVGIIFRLLFFYAWRHTQDKAVRRGSLCFSFFLFIVFVTDV